MKIKINYRKGKHKVAPVRGSEVWLHSFSPSALDGDEWSASCPGRFTREKTTAGIH
jgi:hypothetical protein